MDPTLFYGNDGTDIGTVHSLPLKSFRELVDRKLNICCVLNVTKRQLMAMTKKERHAVKRVPYVVPATFRYATSRRRMEFAESYNLIALDIDNGDDAAPFVRAPELLHEALMPFNFAAYETVSSTSESPRLRILVEADDLPLKSYRDAVNCIAMCLGLKSVTSESYVVIQPMYLPTLCKGQDEDEDHPLIAYDVNGRQLSSADLVTYRRKAKLRKDGQDDYSDDYHDNEKKTGPTRAKQLNSLEFLRPQVKEITLEDVEEALCFISPDLPYNEWVSVAAALRHQFQGEDAEEAYAIFDEWSKTGEKYDSAEDTRLKWDSLRPTPIGRAPLTIRSVLTQAVAGGWEAKGSKDRCFRETLKWIQAEERTSSELLSDGLGKILATPLISQSEEEALMNSIVEEMKRRWGMRITVTTVRKDLKALKQQMTVEAKARKGPTIPGWAKGLCYVAATNQFFRHATRESFSPEALDSTYARKLLPSEEELLSSGNTGSLKAASTPVARPREFLLNVTQVPTVYDYIYDPRQPNDTFLILEDRPYVNLYVPTHPEPDPSQSLYAGEMFMMHLGNLIKEPEYQRVVMDYLAYMVQFPGAKIRWAILIQGVEGCGKTFIAEAMKIILGRGHVRTIDSNALHSQWNDWAYGSQLVTLEEIRVAGHSRHEVMNALKPLISNDYINVNQRHRDSRQVDNTSNYLLFTNHHDSLVLTHGDRRYFVLKSPLQTKNQVLNLGSEYFRDLFGMLANYGAGLRHFLENWGISDYFDPDGHAPATHYLRQLINDSASELVVAIREALEDVDHPLVQPDLISSTALVNWLSAHNPHLRVSPQQVASVLRDEGYHKQGRYQVHKKAHYLWAKIGTEAMTFNCRRVAERRLDEFDGIDPDDRNLL